MIKNFPQLVLNLAVICFIKQPGAAQAVNPAAAKGQPLECALQLHNYRSPSES